MYYWCPSRANAADDRLNLMVPGKVNGPWMAVAGFTSLCRGPAGKSRKGHVRVEPYRELGCG